MPVGRSKSHWLVEEARISLALSLVSFAESSGSCADVKTSGFNPVLLNQGLLCPEGTPNCCHLPEKLHPFQCGQPHHYHKHSGPK